MKAPPRLSLSVQYAVDPSRTPSRARLRRWAARALQRDCRVTLRILGAAESRRLNREFRGQDHATNVLTFIYGDSPAEGDIALCAPLIAREARAQAKTVEAHWAHLVVHGMLHLQGWDHVSDPEATAMETLETRIVIELGYSDPYRIAA
ncbi:MAG: rRNA maturation RNase YbeY [Betaproteobacteria bacterium]